MRTASHVFGEDDLDSLRHEDARFRSNSMRIHDFCDAGCQDEVARYAQPEDLAGGRRSRCLAEASVLRVKMAIGRN